MDIDYGKLAGFGAAYGLSVALIAAIIFIPASYVANRYIYHSTWMRILMVVGAVVISPLLFIGMIFGKLFGFAPSINYLGLFPFAKKTDNTFLDLVLEPIHQIVTDPGAVADNYRGIIPGASPTHEAPVEARLGQAEPVPQVE